MATNPSDTTLRSTGRLRIGLGELVRQLGLSVPDNSGGGWGAVPTDAEGALILDGMRKRPRYFDGKFLTAADLTRDQDYIRQRQNDLAAAVGTGVVAGLQVSSTGTTGADSVRIAAGHGVTPSGAIVMISEERVIPLADIAESRRIDAALGLASHPAIPLASRTGLFILALRPVEFSANPIASYPTEINGTRTLQDGDIIEATAITLIAWQGANDAPDLDRARAVAAKTIFGGMPAPLPHDALPIAMVALDRGTVRWLDTTLVRRETGADSPLEVSLGGRPRSMAEAFLMQFQAHLADVLAQRHARGMGGEFAAAEHFSLLPPAGPMPMASIVFGRDGLEQVWLPGASAMQVSLVPQDEIAAIIEETLTLPPIDLTRNDQEGMVVTALVPVPRHVLHTYAANLSSLSRKTMPGQEMRNLRLAGEGLDRMLARRAPLVPARGTSVLSDEEQAQYDLWQAALDQAAQYVPRDANGVPVVYYARQRTAPQATSLVGHSIAIDLDAEARKPLPTPIPIHIPIPLPGPAPAPAPGPGPDPAPSPSAGPTPATPPPPPPDSRPSAPPTPPPVIPAPAPSGEEERIKRIEEQAGELGLKTRLAAVRKAAAPSADADIINVLVNPRVNDVFFANFVHDLELARDAVATPGRDLPTRDRTSLRELERPRLIEGADAARNRELVRMIDRNVMFGERITRTSGDATLLSKADVAAVATDFRRRELGDGLRQLARAGGDDLFSGRKAVWLGDTGYATEIDRAYLELDPVLMARITDSLLTAIKDQNQAALDRIMARLIEGLGR